MLVKGSMAKNIILRGASPRRPHPGASQTIRTLTAYQTGYTKPAVPLLCVSDVSKSQRVAGQLPQKGTKYSIIGSKSVCTSICPSIFTFKGARGLAALAWAEGSSPLL